jgi:DNA-binding NarL/FixJ family response regulator
MSAAPRVLIVEGDLVEAQHLEEAIFEIPERESPDLGVSRRFWWNARVVHSGTLSCALAALADRQADLVLLNPMLADSQGIDSFRMLRVQAPDLPILLILDDESGDEQMGKVALREGAQDFLMRSQCDWESLAHAMETALERSRLMASFWRSFLADPQTGLPNRTGFEYLAGLLQTAHARQHQVSRLIIGAAEEGALLSGLTDLLQRSVDPGDLTGRLSLNEVGVLSTNLDQEQLILRLESSEPGISRGIRWSQWQQRPFAGPFESIDQWIARAESLLPPAEAVTSTACAGSLQ